MKRFFLFLTMLLTISSLCATKRALVIGIGDYPAESGWAKINGDKDIPMVKEMLAANGFSKQHITTLQNQQATCAAIKQAFENLISQAQQGDFLYIHFSGHGQQITDLDGDETDGFDEAWIAYDAQFAFAKGKYEGQNHIIDDQLNGYLHRLRGKIGNAGKIVVVADACHSGDGSRADDGSEVESLVVRGTADAFVIANAKTTATAVSYPIQWTFISACKPYQCNYEYQGNGSLTYALYQQKDNFSTLDTKQIKDRIKKCIGSIVPFTQTPVVEVSAGKENDIFF